MIDRNSFVLSTLSSNGSLDAEKLFEAYALIKKLDESLREKYEIGLQILDLDAYVYEECKQLLLKDGVSKILSTIRLQEELLPVAKDRESHHLIVKVLRDKISTFAPSNNLVIVDNYIFPSNFRTPKEELDYLQIFEDIFSSTINKIEKIIFVTKPNYNSNLYAKIEDLLLSINPDLSIMCKTTDVFHDRFWIIDKNKGLFVGTSLNGIGKRYAMVDNIRDKDVQELMKVLENLVELDL